MSTNSPNDEQRKLRQLVHDMRSQLFCIEINAKALEMHLPELLECYKSVQSTRSVSPKIPDEHLDLIAHSAAEISECLDAINEKLEQQVIQNKGSDGDPRLETIHVNEVPSVIEEPKLRILLAEDEAIHQDISRKLLRPCNCSLVIADNGEDAIAYLGTESFDLILMDMHMPELNGMQAIKRIRDRVDDKGNIPVIGISNIEPLDAEEFFGAGFNAFLLKPLKLDSFINVVLQFHPHWKAKLK